MGTHPYMRSLAYHELVRWREECGFKFGGILDFPMESVHAICLRLSRDGLVLDVGAGVQKHWKKLLRLGQGGWF